MIDQMIDANFPRRTSHEESQNIALISIEGCRICCSPHFSNLQRLSNFSPHVVRLDRHRFKMLFWWRES